MAILLLYKDINKTIVNNSLLLYYFIYYFCPMKLNKTIFAKAKAWLLSGDQTLIAKEAKLSRPFVCDVLNGKYSKPTVGVLKVLRIAQRISNENEKQFS